MSARLRGSCLCGGIRYEVDAPLTEIGHCHCRQCRKANGTAFATNAPVPAAAFRLLEGEELLSHYQSSPNKQRTFCRRCGSPIYSRSTARPGVLRLRIGLLDTTIAQRPDYHFHVADKAEWCEISDGLPQFPQAPDRP